jgi:hypothetical protein
VIKVDYEALTVEGDMTVRFKSKDEMFKAVSKFVISEGKAIPRHTCKKSDRNPSGILDNRPYIFKGQTK